jgi:hypothetical protein
LPNPLIARLDRCGFREPPENRSRHHARGSGACTKQSSFQWLGRCANLAALSRHSGIA